MMPRNRIQDWKIALEACRTKMTQGEVRFLDCEIAWDADPRFSFNTDKGKIPAGDVVRKAMFKKLGLVSCRKSEATILVTIGEKADNGCWLIGKTKNYWLTVDQTAANSEQDCQNIGFIKAAS